MTLHSRRMKATERKSPAPSRYGMKFSTIEISSARTVPYVCSSSRSNSIERTLRRRSCEYSRSTSFLRYSTSPSSRKYSVVSKSSIETRPSRLGGASCDRDRVLAGELAERVADELKVLRPEQRQEVVGRVGLEVARPLQHAQEAHDLGLLDARLERERADAVLVERPGDALGALLLVVDDVVFPAQLGLADIEHQIVGRLPDLAKRRPDVVDGALVHRIVRQVELGGPDS